MKTNTTATYVVVARKIKPITYASGLAIALYLTTPAPTWVSVVRETIEKEVAPGKWHAMSPLTST